MSNSKRILLTIVSIASVALYALFFWPGEKVERAGDAKPREIVDAAANHPVVNVEASKVSPEMSITTSESQGTLPIAPNSEDMGINKSGTQVTPAVAQSDTELDLAWQRKSGFPDAEKLSSFQGISAQDLEKKASAGDIVAKVLLGGELMRHDHSRARGEQLLLEAAADGSIYALHEANARVAPGQPGGSFEKQMAYQQLAVALGDLGMAPFLTLNATNASQEQYFTSQVMFSDLIYRLATLRQSRTGLGLIPNLRPLPTARKKK